MKKIINDPNHIVPEMLAGLVNSRPWLMQLANSNCVVAKASESRVGKVAIVSLGGSGHEPADAGYVGVRGLDGVACGAVFSSPSVEQIVDTAKAVATNAGVFFIVKNYTGDRLNTAMAQEILEEDGIATDKVIVNDDVAVENSTYTTGRRGIVGAVFAFHIAGTVAARGLSLPEVKSKLDSVVSRTRSAGVSFSGCTIPAVGKPGFTIADDEMEWFMGIHGEPGIRRGKIVRSSEIAKDILDRIHADLPFERGRRYAVIVNGCGGTPLMELYILLNDVVRQLKEFGALLIKSSAGNFMTSLEMQGASVSVLQVEDSLEEEILNTPSCVFPF